MPLYEYECSSCGRRFEVIQKFSDEPVKACTHCGGPVNRLLSRSAIRFKGTGWYVTDYARKSSPDAASPSDGKGKENEKPAVAPSEAAKETNSSRESPSKTPSPPKTE